MTRVDFYILQSAGGGQRLACRLAEKAYEKGHRIYIHTATRDQTNELDGLLWSFRDGSFVPHEKITEGGSAEETPVHIGSGQEPHAHDDILINLAPQVPLFFSRFQRVLEIVDGDENERSLGRERYRFYQERGYALNSHHIQAGS